MHLKNSIGRLAIGLTALIFAGGAAGNVCAQTPGFIISDFSFDGHFGMAVFNVDGSNGYNVLPNLDAAPPPGFSGGCTLPPLPSGTYVGAVSPSSPQDGSLIAFASAATMGGQVFVMNADGSGRRQVTFPDPNFPNTAPVISPDGTKIAFLSQSTVGNIRQIFTVNVDGSGLSQITPDSDNVRNGVAWSPDSSQLAFASATCGFFDELKVISADGTGERRLLCKNAVFDTAIDWSPDGTRIAYADDFGGAGIGQVRPDGTSLESLTPSLLGGLNTTLAGAFRYSPDSTRLAYANEITGFRGVSFINVDGTGRQDAINDGSKNHIWWQPGPAIMPPTTLTLGPDPVVVGPNFYQQLSPVLKDSAGNILSRSAYGYCTGNPSFAIANELGFVTPGSPGPVTLMVVENGGLASNTITVGRQATDPPASFYPATFDFGNQGVASPSATQIFTLTNTGSATLTINAITITGANASDFAFDPGVTTCSLAGGPVAAGDSCDIGVVITPSDAGTRSAQIEVDDDATGGLQTIPVTGTGRP